MRYASFLSRLIGIVLGGLFIFAGVLKLADPAAFAWSIHQYGLVPRSVIDPLAVGLPVLEVVSGAGLVRGARWGTARPPCYCCSFWPFWDTRSRTA